MSVFKTRTPFFRHLFCVAFNAGAVRKAYLLRLLSQEFCLGLICWVASAGIVLLPITARVSLPKWFLLPVTMFSVFTGYCWIAFPLFVYLGRKGEQFLAYQIKPGNILNTLTGVSLWHRAVQGKLTLQFLGAILLDVGCIWLLFRWYTNPSWLALFYLAFFVNTLFYIALPFVLFLGKWFEQGCKKKLFIGVRRASSRQNSEILGAFNEVPRPDLFEVVSDEN